MIPTGAIFASDYTPRGQNYQSFTKKHHRNSGKRSFQAPIGHFARYTGPETTECGSDTVRCRDRTKADGLFRLGRIRKMVSGGISVSVSGFLSEFREMPAPGSGPAAISAPEWQRTFRTPPELSVFRQRSSQRHPGRGAGAPGMSRGAGAIRSPAAWEQRTEKKCMEMIYP